MSNSQESKRIRFFIGDDVRSENDKPMIIGLCPNDTVLLGAPAEVADPTNEAPVLLQSLGILAVFIGYKDNEVNHAEASLFLPDGKPVFEHQVLAIEPITARDYRKDIYLALKFAPFPVFQLGQYRLVFVINGTSIDYKFTIDRATRHQPSV
jgi:hypothetical protein